jgi:hypothetical protein
MSVLSPLYSAFLEKLSYLAIHVLYATWKFTTMFKEPAIGSYPKPAESCPHTSSPRTVLILFFHQALISQPKFYMHLPHTCNAQLILNLINLSVQIKNQLSYNFPQSFATSHVQILAQTLANLTGFYGFTLLQTAAGRVS